MLLIVIAVLTFGLIADGVSNEQFTGIVTASGAAGQDNIVVNVGAVTTRPYDGQVVSLINSTSL